MSDVYHEGDRDICAPSKAPRYAVIFRTHFWDDFTQRQYDRLQARVQSGDVYVLVDETRGHVPGIPGRVFRLTDRQILEAGIPAEGEGALQWFSGDVPLYMFFREYPDYEFYFQLEYDVNIHRDVDKIITEIARDRADVVALTKRDTPVDWNWMASCRGAYEIADVTHQLICISIYSPRALQLLFSRRLEQAAQFRAGEIPNWPFCEAFVDIEAKRLGLVQAQLSRYGDVDCYDWFPPFLESELPQLQAHVFVHPVLDREKFVGSCLKIVSGPKTMLLPASEFHRRLHRLGMIGYLRTLFSSAFRQAFVRTWRKRFSPVRRDQAA